MDDVMNEKVAGLDIHEKIIVACAMYTTEGNKRVKKEFSSFPTTTKGLLELHDWLLSLDIKLIAMESTGIYWHCVWRILQNSFSLILANPRIIKGLKGKKTDMKDAEWIARLTRLGVVPKSFVPEQPIQELRDLTRLRKRYVEDVNREKNRAHRVLQSAGIKISNVIKDIFGMSGRNLLQLLLSNEEITEEKIRNTVYTTMKNKAPILLEGMDGFMNSHSKELLKIHLESIDFKEKQIAQLEALIDKALEPYMEYVEILEELPGISRKTASTIIAEIGIDMEHFPSSGHLTSWAGVCPGNNESAGKTKSTKIRKGNGYLKKVLSQGAHAVGNGKPSRIHSFFQRIHQNSGYKKAVVATCALYLRIIYKLFQHKSRYKEFGENYRIKMNLTP